MRLGLSLFLLVTMCTMSPAPTMSAIMTPMEMDQPKSVESALSPGDLTGVGVMSRPVMGSGQVPRLSMGIPNEVFSPPGRSNSIGNDCARALGMSTVILRAPQAEALPVS